MLTTLYYTTSIFVFFITVQITKLKSFKELPSISHFDVTLRNAKFHFFWEVSILPSLSQVKKKKQVSTCSTLMICMTLKKGNNSLGVIEKLFCFSLKPFSQES